MYDKELPTLKVLRHRRPKFKVAVCARRTLCLAACPARVYAGLLENALYVIYINTMLFTRNILTKVYVHREYSKPVTYIKGII